MQHHVYFQSLCISHHASQGDESFREASRDTSGRAESSSLKRQESCGVGREIMAATAPHGLDRQFSASRMNTVYRGLGMIIWKNQRAASIVAVYSSKYTSSLVVRGIMLGKKLMMRRKYLHGRWANKAAKTMHSDDDSAANASRMHRRGLCCQCNTYSEMFL